MHGYTAVVAGWESESEASSTVRAMRAGSPPYYRLLVDTRDRPNHDVTVVAEQSLVLKYAQSERGHQGPGEVEGLVRLFNASLEAQGARARGRDPAAVGTDTSMYCPVLHEDLGEFFDSFDWTAGRFIPNRYWSSIYCEDV